VSQLRIQASGLVLTAADGSACFVPRHELLTATQGSTTKERYSYIVVGNRLNALNRLIRWRRRLL